ncbi:glycosyltransferase [Candidatus Saccharibacteria bacterium]|nr:glycosyltransferase [Candidatus Saccharibacteria bacterium]
MSPNSNIKYQISNIGNPRAAIVCDWMLGGGAEKVVLELHNMFPDAPIYTSYATKRWRHKLNGKVVTGFLQYWPFSKLRKYIPFLRILYFSNLRLKNYDLIISSTGAEAKGIKTRADQTHISYIHAPTHYYWARYDDYLAHPGFGRFDWLARFGLKLLIGPLRKWDFVAAQRPDHILANSTHTAGQIKKYYNRKSTVVFPPIDTERFAIPTEKHGLPNVRRGFVITGRQTPYKRVDLAVAACTQLNVPLIVIGNGPDHKKLKKMAGKTITFLTKVTDRELPHYLQSAEAFLFPGVDDFGIAPVEALAAGTPVIAYKAGGALDFIVEGKTGQFFTKQTPESLAEAIQAFSSNKYSHDGIKTAAAKFSITAFHKNLQAELHNVLQ